MLNFAKFNMYYYLLYPRDMLVAVSYVTNLLDNSLRVKLMTRVTRCIIRSCIQRQKCILNNVVWRKILMLPCNPEMYAVIDHVNESVKFIICSPH